MNRKDVCEFLETFDLSASLLSEEFDPALRGINTDGLVVYEVSAILNILRSQGLTEEEAMEHFSFNIEGSKGEGLPVYFWEIMP